MKITHPSSFKGKRMKFRDMPDGQAFIRKWSNGSLQIAMKVDNQVGSVDLDDGTLAEPGAFSLDLDTEYEVVDATVTYSRIPA